MTIPARYTLTEAHFRIAELEEQLETQEKMLRSYVERFGLILPTDEPRAEVTFPASSSCDHTWSLPENAGVFRCMKCGVETTDVDALDPALRFIGDSPETHITAPNQEGEPHS